MAAPTTHASTHPLLCFQLDCTLVSLRGAGPAQFTSTEAITHALSVSIGPRTLVLPIPVTDSVASRFRLVAIASATRILQFKSRMANRLKKHELAASLDQVPDGPGQTAAQLELARAAAHPGDARGPLMIAVGTAMATAESATVYEDTEMTYRITAEAGAFGEWLVAPATSTEAAQWISAVEDRCDRLEAQVAALTGQVAALTAQVAALTTRLDGCTCVCTCGNRK